MSPEHEIDPTFNWELDDEATVGGAERELESLVSKRDELFQHKYEVLEAQPQVAEARKYNLQLIEQVRESWGKLAEAEDNARTRLSPSLDDLRTYRQLINADIASARHSLAILESEASKRQLDNGRSAPDNQRSDDRPMDVVMEEIDEAKRTVRWYAEEKVKAQSRQTEARNSILKDPEVVEANGEQIRLRLEQETARDGWQVAMRQAMEHHPELVEMQSQLDLLEEAMEQATEEVRRLRGKADEEIRGLR